MINFSLVDVKSITSNTPRSNFLETDLEQLADLILESGGIIRPLIVKVNGLESYIVVDGHFEYYASVRAKEKNPRKAEMVNAFVISPKIENLIIKQSSTIKGLESSDKVIKLLPETTEITKLESRLANLEIRLEKQINEFKSELAQERQKTEDKIKSIEVKTHKQISPLEIFNTLEQTQLILKLINAGINESTANKIFASLEIERKKKKFASLNDVITRVKISHGKSQKRGITPEKMVEILDIWSRI
ncbi:chromosome partitioning protein ParB [Anabaena sp. UHCC 0399]|uniref:chromosome partitioning protein ParB n=1 Tax=Anabaena sp. UHCC 0399 TaxID=3110238 RepID=UPI002B21586B|nr:chromosome partitioning protein ParB [Anabaena sp. UHCC 0399]MEA5565876.1 chromosome partitioning protein ParB [Anabaena sp. UHCC 0399]